MTSTETAPQPDILSFGPPPVAPRTRRGLLAVFSVILAGAVMAGVWVAWLKPPPDFTLTELEGVYAGMVRADGVNEAYTIDASKVAGDPVSVTPDTCAPLFDTTVFNQFPAGALDGVSTYWMADRATVSLFTVRYPDRAAARHAYARVATALAACQDTPIGLRRGLPARGRITPSETTAIEGVRGQLGYSYTSGTRSRFAVHVLHYANTVTWQYRYEPAGAGDYAPLAAQQLMSSLVSQMRSVQSLRA